MEASVCGIPGIQNYINVGDIVYVGFEDNDMGKPVILGHLLTSQLEEKRSSYPGFKVSVMNITDEATLPSTSNIKFLYSDLLLGKNKYEYITYPGSINNSPMIPE